jgi:predicted  nucleic acid-binding Zn-ribbon protein
MTDHDPDESTTPEPTVGDDAPATVPELLLALQAVDTEADQLNHRRVNSPLRANFVAQSKQVEAWERRRAELTTSIDTLGEAIAGTETSSAELLARRQRLERQMKTVIAPREAEALQHEIATIESQRDDLDIEGLEALEQQSTLDDELTVHVGTEESMRAAARLADDALRGEVDEIDTTLADLASRREAVRAELPDGRLATYDRKRAALGVAVAALVGRTCQGCHLELSAAEIDTVRADAAETGVTDCPECGRLLIV